MRHKIILKMHFWRNLGLYKNEGVFEVFLQSQEKDVSFACDNQDN